MIRRIHSGDKLYDFSFVKIQTVKGAKYFVMVADATREFHFIIEKSLGHWKISNAPQVPQWIHDLEALLIKTVKEYEEN